MKKLLVVLLVLWLVGPALFLLRANQQGVFGFPLDDSWIHQTYARSLAKGEGWSYAGGSPSAGSTSPAWTLLQIPSFWLGISPIPWSIGLGLLLLFLTSFCLYFWLRTIHQMAATFAVLLGLGEWHLVWAELSGMETVLFTCWAMSIIMLWFFHARAEDVNKGFPFKTLFYGILLGAGIWIRPEAVLLSSFAIVFWFSPLKRRKWKSCLALLLGMIFPLSAYFRFEYGIHNLPWPNTFYAKPAEYAVLTAQNIIFRFLNVWIPLLAGPLALLVIFIPFYIILNLRKGFWKNSWPLMWALAHVALYSVQLPTTYQHGRYLIPVLPVLLGYGLLGFFQIRDRLSSFFLTRVFLKASWISMILLTLIFLFLGSGQYAIDVGIIETEMVASAVWIRNSTPPNSLVAAHDIGALGFWGQRRIIDLGGLTDLDALTLLSGKTTLHEYLSQKHANYLVTFPSFYPGELGNCVPIRQSEGIFSSLVNGDRTAVYVWENGCRQP